MVREEQFSFSSEDKRTTMHGVRWIPDGEICAVMQICHGMAEYIERYREFGTYLAEHGVLVVGHDHLGHGGSVCTEHDYGYFAEKNGNKIVVRDIHSVYKLTKNAHPDVPYIMFGHSMGSFLVRQYLCCHGDGLDGAILCGTGHQPEVILKAGMAAARIQAAFMGWHYKSGLLQQMSFGSYNSSFRPNRTESDWLSRDEEKVDAYVEDPKCGFAFTTNGYYNMFLGMLKLLNQDYLLGMPHSLPVFFIAGAKDPVGDCGKGVTKVSDSFEALGMERVSCKLYPEARHEILNEINREEVYADVWNWIQENCLQTDAIVHEGS